MPVFGEWSRGPVQFGNGGVIETRGTQHFTPEPAAPTPHAQTQTPSLPSGPNPTWGGNIGSVGGGLGTPVNPATNNGGSYGLGGAGADMFRGQGPGGFDADTGTAFFDDGGVVPGMVPEAPAAPVDPQSMVAGALKFGRSAMGLPESFYGQSGQSGQVPTQSFDDGGEVEEESAEDQGVLPQAQDEGGEQPGQQPNVTAGGNSPPDPRQAIKYLAGDGAVDPGIVAALEQRIDPQGGLDPSARAMAAISAAPNPEAAFGLLQHYRTKFNGYSGGARAALDQGNLGGAAAHATQAFANVPTGFKVQFAPARGGVAMRAEQYVGGAGAGGGAGGGAQPKPQQSFDGGGMVDDGDEDGVIPTQETPPEGQPAIETNPEGMPEQASEPVILSPEQFKNVLTAGFDKPLDGGWGAFISSILSNVNPVGTAEAAPAQQPGSSSLPNMPSITDKLPGGQGPGVMENPLKSMPSLVDKVKGLFGGGGDDVAAAMASNTSAPTPGEGPAQQSVVPKSTRSFETTPYGPKREPAPQPGKKADPYGDMSPAEQRIMNMANRLFPSAGQAQQKRQYIVKMLEAQGTQQNKIDVEQAKGRQQIEQTREQGRNQRLERQEAGKNQRQGNASLSRERIAQLHEMSRSWNEQQRNQVRMLGQQLVADPSLARDPAKASERVNKLAEQLGVNRADVRDMIKQLNPEFQGQGDTQAQQPEGNSRPPAQAIQMLRTRRTEKLPSGRTVEQEFAAKYGKEWLQKALGQ